MYRSRLDFTSAMLGRQRGYKQWSTVYKMLENINTALFRDRNSTAGTPCPFASAALTSGRRQNALRGPSTAARLPTFLWLSGWWWGGGEAGQQDLAPK